MTRFHIFAGNHVQARHLAEEMNLGRLEWSYITHPQALLGLRGGAVLAYGSCLERQDADQIIEMAMEREMRILSVQSHKVTV